MPLSDREWYASCNNLLVAHSSAFKFFYYTWTKPFLHLLHPLKFHKIIVNHFSGNRIHRCKTNEDVFFFRSSMVGQLNAVWLNPVKRNIKITLPWAMYFIGYRLVIFFNLHEKIPIVALPQRPTPSLGDFIWTMFFVVSWLHHFNWIPGLTFCDPRYIIQIKSGRSKAVKKVLKRVNASLILRKQFDEKER